MEAEGTFVAINNKVSQSVPHLHVHVVPGGRRDGLRGFFWPRLATTARRPWGGAGKDTGRRWSGRWTRRPSGGR